MSFARKWQRKAPGPVGAATLCLLAFACSASVSRAADRAEGTVVAAERELPGCPRTEATFAAAPGEIPPFVKPQVFAVQNAKTGHLAQRPHEIVLGLNQRGSLVFHGLEWRSFGDRKAYATGRAEIREGTRRWHLRASLRLSSLLEDGPDKQIYSVVRYVLRGPVPSGFARRNFREVR